MCDPLAPTAVAGLPSAMKLSPSLPSRVAVGCQWITHRAVLLVQRSLGQSLLQSGGDPESGSLVKSGENVVGSHGRRTVSQDHVEYRTRSRTGTRIAGLTPGSSTRSIEAMAARASKVRSPFLVIRSTTTSSVASSARTASPRLLGGHAVDGEPPPGGLQPVGQGTAGAGHDLDDIEARRQGGVDVGVGARRVELLGERDLEVLRLARRAGRRGAGVGDARVGVEARGVGHRDPRPEDGALEGPAEVAVAGEPEPPALGVPQPQPLDGRRLLLGLFTHVA